MQMSRQRSEAASELLRSLPALQLVLDGLTDEGANVLVGAKGVADARERPSGEAGQELLRPFEFAPHAGSCGRPERSRQI